MSLGFKIYNALKVCPFCTKELEIHPLAGTKSCFRHGDFIVKELDGQVTVEFKIMPKLNDLV
jgi:hypothetical protein